jgi:hypothetical protein
MGNAEYWHDDPFGEPYGLREGCEAGGDPSLLGGEKSQTLTRRYAGRQDQLDFAFGRIDPQRDPPRPRTDPDRNVGSVRRHSLPSYLFQCNALPDPP